MARGPSALVLVLVLTLAGCSATVETPASLAGLTAGPLPAPKPFVVEARKPIGDAYPPVGVTPPPRQDRVMTPEEVKKLEEELARQRRG